MSSLEITKLSAGIPGREILHEISLTVKPGEVHAIMGPNGSGKSTLAHVLMGRHGYEGVSGSIKLDGQELLGLPTWQRAQAGLFLAMQYPVEVPGVSLIDALSSSAALSGRGDLSDAMKIEADNVGLRVDLLERPLNVDLSGGEKKRNETLQLGLLRSKYAVLDEIDSGLDIDALRAVSRRIERATSEWNLGVIAITHYSRLLKELKPDVIHVLSAGRLVASGGPELADELESTGYASYGGDTADESESSVATPFDL